MGERHSSERIFKTLINRKIDLFLSTFEEEADLLFKNDSKLIHPGEYGMYRERSLKSILRTLFSKRFEINDGFIFNKKYISTQCDIIISDSSMDTITADGLAKYYPIEYVYAIGEVKSSLSTSELKEVAIKLAKNKQLGSERLEQSNDVTALMADNVLPVSFIVCKNINGIDNIDESFWDDVYKDFEDKYRHNIILSIEDGYFAYGITVNHVVGNGIDYVATWPHPVIKGEKLNNRFIPINKKDKYYHLYSFIGVLVDSVNSVEQLEFPIMDYLEVANDDFKEYLGMKDSVKEG